MVETHTDNDHGTDVRAEPDRAETPVGAVAVASFASYPDAERAVDRLSDAKFPVERAALVGRELRLVENVTARLTIARAALLGAAGGVWLGLLVGLFLALFTASSFGGFLGMPLTGILLGAVFGAVFGGVAHAMTGGRRDFSSFSRIEAGRYDLIVDADVAGPAQRLLAKLRPPGMLPVQSL